MHGIGGIVGAVLTGVFAVSSVGGEAAKGLIDGNAGQIVTQLYGVGVTVLWSGIVTALLLKAIDLVIGLRVSEEIEREGLDLHLHGEIMH